MVIIKEGSRACGSGGVLANSPLIQSKSYFEVKLQQAGHWSIGIATRDTNLNATKGGQDKESWCLTSQNAVFNNKDEIHRLAEEDNLIDEPRVSTSTGLNNKANVPQEGDVIGVTYDHVELNFYLNGKNMEVPVLNVKGDVYPCLFVDDGAILDIVLDNFNFNPPPGYDRIMIEHSLL